MDVREGSTVEMLHRSPNHRIGQRGTATAASPTGHTNAGLHWVDYGEPIQWSHGQSESTGEWCGPGEFRVIEVPDEDADRTLAELAERQAQPNGLEGVL